MRKIITAILLVIMLAAGTAALSFLYFSHPERLRPFLEGRMRHLLNTDVSIGDASLALSDYEIDLTLTGLKAGAPDGLYVQTDLVEFRMSPWHLLLGTPRISYVRTTGSDVRVPFDVLLGKSSLPRMSIPHFDVEGTTLRLTGRSIQFNFENIRGFFRESALDVTMRAFGGDARISAHQNGDAWEGAASLAHVNLADINPRTSGSSQIDISFSVGGTDNHLALRAAGTDIVLPWYDRNMPEVLLSLSAGGSGDTFDIRSLTLTSPVIQLTGSGLLSDVKSLDAIGNAVLTLDLKSNEFEYEEFIRAIPTVSMPEWLSLLLTRQIRDGRSRFSSLGYRGRLRDFAVGETYYWNMSGELEIMEQSFGSGFGAARIRNVSGTARYLDRTLEIRNLHGSVGASELKSVTLVFERVEAPGMYLTIDTEFNMAAADFFEGWKAVMIDEEIAGAFSMISAVGAGRIRGNVTAYTVDPSDTPTLMEGAVSLTGCNFTLGNKKVSRLSGALTKQSFSSPLSVDMHGSFDDMNVTNLSLTFKKLFADNAYTFSVETAGLPVMKSFRLSNGASLAIEGEGRGTAIEGSVRIAAPGVEIFGTPYRPQKGTITGRGRVKGAIWPDIEISVPEMDISVPPGEVKLVSAITDTKGRSHITGRLNLDQFQAYTKDTYRNLGGVITGDVTVTWGETTAVSGTVVCEKALLYYEGDAAVLDGAIIVTEKTLGSEKLNIHYGDTLMAASGTLALETPPRFEGTIAVDIPPAPPQPEEKEGTATQIAASGTLVMEDIPRFEGDITVSGLLIGRGKTGEIDLPDRLSARGRLRFTDLNLYGIDVKTGSSTAVLDNRVLRLEDMTLEIPSGTLVGSTTIQEQGEAAFDVRIAIRDGNLREYVETFSGGRSSIRGKFSASGRISGTGDTIDGMLSFKSVDGRIMQYATISRIFSVLNVYKIIKTGELDLGQKGFPYNRMSATFAIRKGVAEFNDFHIDSNSLQLSAAGKYSFKKDTIDAVVGVQPLEVIDRTVSAIPLVGWIVTGKDGKFIVVSLRVTGELDDPKVVPAPVESIKPAGEIIFRTLNLPLDLIDNIRKMMRKDEDKEDSK